MIQTSKIKLLIVAALFTFNLGAQNDVSLQLEQGGSFKVLVEDQYFNRSAHTHVMLHDIKEDTLRIKIELEDGHRYGITLYLLNKGKHTSKKEFNYLLKKERNRLRPVFTGMYAITPAKKEEEQR